jgi:hypothetical protein
MCKRSASSVLATNPLLLVCATISEGFTAVLTYGCLIGYITAAAAAIDHAAQGAHCGHQ